MITVYTICFNEELLLPYFIKHYRSNFPGCRIIVYDNYSTDATRTIAINAGCEVILYDTNNQLDDMKYLEIKNHCWQNQKDTWVIVADCDELFDINAEQLLWEAKQGATIIRSQGYDMVNMENNNDVHNITHAVANERYSKWYCFNTKQIKEINYTPGCHEANPVGRIKMSFSKYACYHYRYINPQFLIRRYNQNKLRMCDNNRKKGMGSQYFNNEHQIKAEFDRLRSEATLLREPMNHDGLKVFITYYEASQLQRIPQSAHLTPLNLSQLPLAEFQDNRLSEHRMYLSAAFDNEHCPYLGNLTWRWFQKNKFMMPLENVWQLHRSPNVVWAAWPDANWYRKSCIDHPGMQKYLDELLEFTGLSSEGVGLLANQFICSNKVFKEFQAFFLKVFTHFHGKYGFDGFNFDMMEKYKANNIGRMPALFYERVAALYFANRHDLIIKQIPHK